MFLGFHFAFVISLKCVVVAIILRNYNFLSSDIMSDLMKKNGFDRKSGHH